MATEIKFENPNKPSGFKWIAKKKIEVTACTYSSTSKEVKSKVIIVSYDAHATKISNNTSNVELEECEEECDKESDEYDTDYYNTDDEEEDKE
jgi:hypothetical protein